MRRDLSRRIDRLEEIAASPSERLAAVQRFDQAGELPTNPRVRAWLERKIRQRDDFLAAVDASYSTIVCVPGTDVVAVEDNGELRLKSGESLALSPAAVAYCREALARGEDIELVEAR